MKKLFAGLLLLACSACVLAKDVVIDVRTPQEYAAGHIDGAININHSDIAQEISKADLAKDDRVILYCRSGNRSGIAQDTLKKTGFTRVENYGGMDQARQLLNKK
jgi:phage shock protein E